MKIFNIFKKNKNKEAETMTTLEQVRKAYEDLSEDDKKSFHQSIADRVHESIAAQERADENEDSQSAADREHEALGAEHADGKGDVEELHETDKGEGKETVAEAEEKKEERTGKGGFDAFMERFESKFDSLISKIDGLAASKDKTTAERAAEEIVEEKAAETYGIGNGIFQGNSADAPASEKLSPKAVADVLQKIKK